MVTIRANQIPAATLTRATAIQTIVQMLLTLHHCSGTWWNGKSGKLPRQGQQRSRCWFFGVFPNLRPTRFNCRSSGYTKEMYPYETQQITRVLILAPQVSDWEWRTKGGQPWGQTGRRHQFNPFSFKDLMGSVAFNQCTLSSLTLTVDSRPSRHAVPKLGGRDKTTKQVAISRNAKERS